MITVELGNIGSEKQAKKISNKLEGKTYMNFLVYMAPDAGNWPVSICTENEKVTEKELMEMVVFVLASEI